MTESNKENVVRLNSNTSLTTIEQESEHPQNRITSEEIVSEAVEYLSRLDGGIEKSYNEKERLRELNLHINDSFSNYKNNILSYKLKLNNREIGFERLYQKTLGNIGLVFDFLQILYNKYQKENQLNFNFKIADIMFNQEINSKLNRVTIDDPEIQMQLNKEEDFDDILLFANGNLD